MEYSDSQHCHGKKDILAILLGLGSVIDEPIVNGKEYSRAGRCWSTKNSECEDCEDDQ